MRYSGDWTPGLDALEGRHLLSYFAGPSPSFAAPSTTREVIPVVYAPSATRGDTPLVISPSAMGGVARVSYANPPTTGSGLLTAVSNSPRGLVPLVLAPSISHETATGEIGTPFPSHALDGLGDYHHTFPELRGFDPWPHLDLAGQGGGSITGRSVTLARVTASRVDLSAGDNVSGDQAPSPETGPIRGFDATASFPNFLTPADRGFPFGPAAFRYGMRAFEETFGSTGPALTPQNLPLVAASEAASPRAATLPAATGERGMAIRPSSAEAPLVVQSGTTNPSPSSSFMPQLGSPGPIPGQPDPGTPRTESPTGLATAEGASPSPTLAREGVEIPPPRGADLITSLIPFERESVEESLAWVRDRLEGLRAPLGDEAERISYVVPIVTTLGALEFARRWRQKQANPGALRSWKSRSSVLRGFF